MKHKDFKSALEFLVDYGFEYCYDSATGKRNCYKNRFGEIVLDYKRIDPNYWVPEICVEINYWKTVIDVEKEYKKIKAKNPDFKVILGNEIYLCRNGLTWDNFVKGEDQYFHFILLAVDDIGHQQIREISTRAWMRSYLTGKMRRVPTYYSDIEEIIGQNPGHVIGTTACLGGFLGSIIMAMDATQNANYEVVIERWLKKMLGIFGVGYFYLEMQPSASKEQTLVNGKILELSKKHDIPYIISTDSHYLKKEDAPLHSAFIKSQDGDREVESFYATTYLMGTEELESYMSNLGRLDFEYAYENIRKIKNII